MKTINIQIEDALHKAAKSKALYLNISLKDWIIQAMQEKLLPEGTKGDDFK